MAWWLPLIAMANSMRQQGQQEESAKNNRLRYYGGSDRSQGMSGMGGSTSLLSSVFGVDDTKKKKPGIFDQLNDINKSTPSNVGLDDSTIGGAFYDL
jgi:hypothetical protein